MFERLKMEKKLKILVVIFVSAVLLLAFLFPARKKVYDLEKRTFSTQKSTTLYFKNTRAFYYWGQEMPEAGLTVYRYGKCLHSDSLAYLNFIIVHNWRADEVYIATEPSKALLDAGPVTIRIGDALFPFHKETMNNEVQYDLAAAIFNALLSDKPIILEQTGENLFGTAANQEANLTVLEDYFKWIYKYR